MSLPAVERKNKKRLSKDLVFDFILSFKTIVMMKLTAIFLFAFCFGVQAKGFPGHISLSEKKASLEKLFIEITNQSGYHFFYTDEMLQDAKAVSIDVLERYSEKLGVRMSQLMFFAEELENEPAKNKGKLIVAGGVLKLLETFAPKDFANEAR